MAEGIPLQEVDSQLDRHGCVSLVLESLGDRPCPDLPAEFGEFGNDRALRNDSGEPRCQLTIDLDEVRLECAQPYQA